MRLFKIKTRFDGKDLHETVLLCYIVAENAQGAYDHINAKHNDNFWPDSVEMTEEEIIQQGGDFESNYFGEFYDQKFGWEDLGEVTEEDVARLKRLRMLHE